MDILPDLVGADVVILPLTGRSVLVGFPPKHFDAQNLSHTTGIRVPPIGVSRICEHCELTDLIP